MNGLIGETESLLSKIIQLLSDNFKDDFSSLEYLTRIINRMLGFLVVVPSNPEDQFFILVEGMMSLIRENEWTTDKSYKLRSEIYINIIRFLTSQ